MTSQRVKSEIYMIIAKWLWWIRPLHRWARGRFEREVMGWFKKAILSMPIPHHPRGGYFVEALKMQKLRAPATGAGKLRKSVGVPSLQGIPFKSPPGWALEEFRYS